VYVVASIIVSLFVELHDTAIFQLPYAILFTLFEAIGTVAAIALVTLFLKDTHAVQFVITISAADSVVKHTSSQ
jgi:hypothetical protein